MMRTYRGIVAVAATATLMLAATAAASAQSAQSPAITGTLELASPSGAIDVQTHAWHASDARLDGFGAVGGGFSFYDTPSGEIGDPAHPGELSTYEISTPDGSWRCLTSGPAHPEPDNEMHQLIFDGVGGYDGLTAVVAVDWSASPITFSGVIVDDDIPVRPTLAG